MRFLTQLLLAFVFFSLSPLISEIWMLKSILLPIQTQLVELVSLYLLRRRQNICLHLLDDAFKFVSLIGYPSFDMYLVHHLSAQCDRMRPNFVYLIGFVACTLQHLRKVM